MKVITGSGYQVNPRTLGYNTCTYIGIRLEKGRCTGEVESELKRFPRWWNAITPPGLIRSLQRCMRATTSI